MIYCLNENIQQLSNILQQLKYLGNVLFLHAAFVQDTTKVTN